MCPTAANGNRNSNVPLYNNNCFHYKQACIISQYTCYTPYWTLFFFWSAFEKKKVKNINAEISYRSVTVVFLWRIITILYQDKIYLIRHLSFSVIKRKLWKLIQEDTCFYLRFMYLSNIQRIKKYLWMLCKKVVLCKKVLRIRSGFNSHIRALKIVELERFSQPHQ